MCGKRKRYGVSVVLTVTMLCLCCLFLYGIRSNSVNAADTDVLIFAPTSENTCSVRLKDKTVKRVAVPQKTSIDGKEYIVTSVVANGFASAVNLEKVVLPKTVNALGSGCFLNCKKLLNIAMPAVESIATNAFGMCTSLEYLILPETVTTLGATILRNSPQVKIYARAIEAQTGWASNWNMISSNVYADVEYGSSFNPEIEYEKVINTESQSIAVMADEPIMGLQGDYYVVSECQAFACGDCDVYIPATYKSDTDEREYPVMKISNLAFPNNYVNTLTVGYSEEPIYIESMAFIGLTANKVIINRPVILYDELNEGVSDNIFGDASVNTVILPDNIDKIADNMFAGSGVEDILFIEPQNVVGDETQITNEYYGTGIVKLPKAVTEIGFSAFARTHNLKEIHVPDSVQKVGGSAFSEWKSSAEVEKLISIDFKSESDLPAFWDGNWKMGCEPSIVMFNGIYNITYVTNGGTHFGNPETYKPIDSFELKPAEKEGYIFDGWYENEDYSGNEIKAIVRGMSGDKTLYAKWQPIKYTVCYIAFSPIEVDAAGDMQNSTHYYGIPSALNNNEFSLTGWKFKNWNTENDGSGNSYENGENVVSLSTTNQDVITLYAQWEPIPYKLTFDSVGGSGVSDIEMTYGKPIGALPKSNRANCMFLGWGTEKYKGVNVFEYQAWWFAENKTVYAQWSYKISFNTDGGESCKSAWGVYGETINLPSSYLDSRHGIWEKLPAYERYDFSSRFVVEDEATEFIASWDRYITFVQNGKTIPGGTTQIKLKHGDRLPNISIPTRDGYELDGYFYGAQISANRYYYSSGAPSRSTFNLRKDITLNGNWIATKRVYIVVEGVHINYLDNPKTFLTTQKVYDDILEYEAQEIMNIGDNPYSFTDWKVNLNGYDGAKESPWQSFSNDRKIYIKVEDLINKYFPNYKSTDNIYFRGFYRGSVGGCVAPETLITLADGSQKPVRELSGKEELLVWNLKTGAFDTAPILFIDMDAAKECEIIRLIFSDGTSVKVISEHGFWDFDLNKYVYLDRNAERYLGHWFNKQITDENGNLAYAKVQLTDVRLSREYTTAWSPVTYGHLCYYVNGMLSMPGGIGGMFNIFEVNAETMQYDAEAFEADIIEYGEFTFEEFAELVPVSEEVFNAFNGKYLKVAIGKGLIDVNKLTELVERYKEFLM